MCEPAAICPSAGPALSVKSVLPMRRHTIQLLFLQFVLGAALVLPQAPARGLHALALNPASRAGAVQCAYNPQPSKAKPRKAKVKGPKEKGPPSAAAAQQLVPEQTFFEGPPSITETFIPGLSVLTVVGVIPFSAALARQAWTRYKLTNKRFEIASGALLPPLLLRLPRGRWDCPAAQPPSHRSARAQASRARTWCRLRTGRSPTSSGSAATEARRATWC